MWCPVRVLRDWIRSLSGGYLEPTRILGWCTRAATLREVQMDSRKTPDGLLMDSRWSPDTVSGVYLDS